MNKLQTVLDIVRKANPETMELSFGCEVGRYNHMIEVRHEWVEELQNYAQVANHDGVHEYFISEAVGEISLMRRNHVGDWQAFQVPSSLKEGWKIIGHPLYPAHLLVALKKIEGVYDSYFVHSNGWLMWQKVEDGKETVKQLCLLNLTQPLEPQLQADPELVETLYKLLVPTDGGSE